MMTLLKKEFKLTASPISFVFILFSLMAFIPNYPILICGFFTCLGISKSFQSGRESSDILYTAMLPVRKSDVVRAKYAFTVFIQMSGFILLAVFVLIRTTALGAVPVYVQNNLMNANVAFAGYYLMICACFNVFFVNSYFKTAYNTGVPFLVFGIAAFIFIALAETLHFLPGCAGLNSTFFEPVQLVIFVIGVAVYLLLTFICLRQSIRRFERIDL